LRRGGLATGLGITRQTLRESGWQANGVSVCSPWQLDSGWKCLAER